MSAPPDRRSRRLARRGREVQQPGTIIQRPLGARAEAQTHSTKARMTRLISREFSELFPRC